MRETCGPRTTSRVRPAGSPGMQQLLDRVGGGDLAQLGVGAVHGLGPRVDRAAGGDLEDVGREAPVGQAQVERGGARVAAELQVRELGDLEAAGALCATAPSTSASSRSDCSSAQWVWTILSFSACSPSAPDSIEASTQ